MELAICVQVIPMSGGFSISELNFYLSKGYTVKNAYSSTDNSLLVILNYPIEESKGDTQ